MKLTEHSQKKFRNSFELWRVDHEYQEPMYNYLVHGFSPGGFFTSVLANDFARAVQRSHPANTIPALKALVGWLGDRVPREAYGSYERVDKWLTLTSEQRREILVRNNLVFSEEQETWEILNEV